MKLHCKILITAVQVCLYCLFAVFFGTGPLYAEDPVSQDTKIQRPFVSKPSVPKKSKTVRNLSAMKSRSTDKAVPRITAPRFPVFDKKVQY
ncbi:MAG: hypothetical protein GY795_42995, partial [Desulfobacterales bacterium]|nr:hypothetical protein [Desulfobacterales bacterium]